LGTIKQTSLEDDDQENLQQARPYLLETFPHFLARYPSRRTILKNSPPGTVVETFFHEIDMI
jgi:hypothetical protein